MDLYFVFSNNCEQQNSPAAVPPELTEIQRWVYRLSTLYPKSKCIVDENEPHWIQFYYQYSNALSILIIFLVVAFAQG